MIIQINGQPVSVGDVVTLASGEPIELTPSSFVTLTVGIAVDESVFFCTVEDADGNTDVGFVTLSAVTCFTSGTLINTEHRARSVDSLVPGDLIKNIGPPSATAPLGWTISPAGSRQRRPNRF